MTVEDDADAVMHADVELTHTVGGGDYAGETAAPVVVTLAARQQPATPRVMITTDEERWPGQALQIEHQALDEPRVGGERWTLRADDRCRRAGRGAATRPTDGGSRQRRRRGRSKTLRASGSMKCRSDHTQVVSGGMSITGMSRGCRTSRRARVLDERRRRSPVTLSGSQNATLGMTLGGVSETIHSSRVPTTPGEEADA